MYAVGRRERADHPGEGRRRGRCLVAAVVEVAKPEGLVNIDVLEEDAAKVAGTLGLPVVALRYVGQMGPVDWTCHPDVFVPRAERWGRTSGYIAREDGPLW